MNIESAFESIKLSNILDFRFRLSLVQFGSPVYPSYPTISGCFFT
jgi:hypothetical protein